MALPRAIMSFFCRLVVAVEAAAVLAWGARHLRSGAVGRSGVCGDALLGRGRRVGVHSMSLSESGGGGSRFGCLLPSPSEAWPRMDSTLMAWHRWAASMRCCTAAGDRASASICPGSCEVAGCSEAIVGLHPHRALHDDRRTTCQAEGGQQLS